MDFSYVSSGVSPRWLDTSDIVVTSIIDISNMVLGSGNCCLLVL